MARNSNYDDRQPMRGKVWVGRVKSNCPPEFLEAEFAKIGKLIQVETGFAGFAFVDYEDEEDADDACKKLNKTFLQNVGEVLVSRATQRGYEDACTKRDIYQRTKGRIGEVYQCGDRGSRGMYGSSRSPRRSRSRRTSASRSPSRKRQRADSRSRSLGRPRRRQSPRESPSLERKFRPKNRSPSASPCDRRSRSATRSKSKERSCSRSRSKSLVRPGGGKPENGSRSPPKEQLESNVEEPRAASPDPAPESKPDPVPPEPKPIARAESPPPARISKTESKEIVPKESSPAPAEPPEQPPVSTDPYRLALEPVPAVLAVTSPVTTLAPLAPIFERSDSGAPLSSSDRSAMVQFFDGASTRELMLESAAVLSVPELFTPDILNGFPHAFHGLSQEGVINLMNVFSGFMGGGAPPARDTSAEVRQTILVNTRGQRVMRKTILVDGNVCCSEEQVLA